ncbi:MAG: methionine repressor-like protein [Acidobacteriota bacterium]|nr:methionine repressor-like protein [Acidobacteriota bacterium]
MVASSTRWNLVVSSDLDKSLRQFLAREGRGKKGELSRFVEDAVKKTVFEMTAQEVKKRNASVPLEEIEAIVEESLAWTRRQK